MDKLTEFILAFSRSNLTACKQVLQSCVKEELLEILENKDHLGNTYLLDAVHQRNTAFAKLFIEFGSNVNSVNINTKTPLATAALNGDCEIAQILIDKGADVNWVHKNSNGLRVGDSPLIYAVHANSLEMIKLLLKNGADLNYQTKSGRSAFDLACSPLGVDLQFNLDMISFLATHEHLIVPKTPTYLKKAINSRNFEVTSYLMKSFYKENQRPELLTMLNNNPIQNYLEHKNFMQQTVELADKIELRDNLDKTLVQKTSTGKVKI